MKNPSPVTPFLIVAGAISFGFFAPCQASALFFTGFESDAVGATTAAGAVGGVRNIAGAIVRDSFSVAPFGAENQYLQFGGPGVSDGTSGARAIVAGPPSSSYTETVVGISFKFYDANPSSTGTRIGVGSWTFATGPDLNAQRGVFSLNFNDGAVAFGNNTSAATGTLPSYNTGRGYEITYFMNWTDATATVTGVDGAPVTLETQQIGFWMKDLVDDNFTDTVVLNSSVVALSGFTSLVFRNFSSPEADQNILYLDDLNIAVVIPEPSTWALILGLSILAPVCVARHRRNCKTHHKHPIEQA